MPQLVKGGKNAFSWTRVTNEGKVIIPHDAFEEYGFNDGDIAILLSGSIKSGGFSINRLSNFKDSAISVSVFEAHPELEGQKIPEGQTIKHKSKYFCWVSINEKSITIPSKTLEDYGIKKGMKLLAVRGSDLGIAFVCKGPIIEEAKKHSELMTYQ